MNQTERLSRVLKTRLVATPAGICRRFPHLVIGRIGRPVPALLGAAVLGACAVVPPSSSSDTFEVSWSVSLEHDSCAKLAGFAALNALFRVEGTATLREKLSETINRRCPDFAELEPETLDLEITFSATSCDELNALLSMVAAFDAVAMLDPEEQRLAEDVIDQIEAEVDTRCPMPSHPPASP